MKNGYTVYRNTSIDTADQGKLILIAYDVAIKHCKLALEKFGSRELIEERTKHIFKAQDAITELLTALKLDVGDIALNLYRLYDYMLRCLVEGSIKSNKEKVEEVLTHLQDLRDAWSEAILKLKRESGESAVMQDNRVTVNG